MTYYLDPSFVVAALVADEAHSTASRAWLGIHASADIAVSDWVSTEVSSALSIKIRRGNITVEERNDILSEWQFLRSTSLGAVSVPADAFETAARFADRHDIGLRAADALHIAIALAHGRTLVTLDRVMATAATACSVPVITPRPRTTLSPNGAMPS